MDGTDSDLDSSEALPASSPRLSYKFQRLRERIRAAIAAGELVGKLPGERSLARQFNVNAKTLSKALTDLAAEGVLQRNIGLGTFVRDESALPVSQKILLLTAAENSPLAATLGEFGLDVQHHAPSAELLPSLFAPFDLVLVASPEVQDEQVRDLIVRGKTVLTIDRHTTPYSTHALMAHHTLAATHAARSLSLLGHNQLVLVLDDPADTMTHRAVVDALPHVTISALGVADALAAVDSGFTGLIGSYGVATQLLSAARLAGVTVPDSFSIMAYGRVSGEPGCCGHYVTDRMIAQAIRDLLTTGLPHQPVTLWLSGEHTDRGTTAPPRLITPSSTSAHYPNQN